MEIEVPQNRETSGRGKNEVVEEVNCAIRRRANRRSVNVKKRMQGRVV